MNGLIEARVKSRKKANNGVYELDPKDFEEAKVPTTTNVTVLSQELSAEKQNSG